MEKNSLMKMARGRLVGFAVYCGLELDEVNAGEVRGHAFKHRITSTVTVVVVDALEVVEVDDNKGKGGLLVDEGLNKAENIGARNQSGQRIVQDIERRIMQCVPKKRIT